MKRRLRKKLHKKYLDYIIDLSYVGNASKSRHWRTRLMAADFSVPLQIDKHTLGKSEQTGLHPLNTKAVARYNLVYQVTKLPCCEDGWEHGSYVTFRFQSVEFPEINTYSINNTET